MANIASVIIICQTYYITVLILLHKSTYIVQSGSCSKVWQYGILQDSEECGLVLYSIHPFQEHHDRRLVGRNQAWGQADCRGSGTVSCQRTEGTCI